MSAFLKGRRSELLLYGLAFGCFFQQSVLLPVLPRFAGDLGAPVAMIGVILAIRFLAPALFAARVGALVARFGLRRSLIASGLGMAAASALYLIADDVATLILAQLVNGAIYMAAWLGAQTYATQLPNRDFVLGVFATFTAIGMAVAPVLGGMAMDLGGYGWAFALYGAGALALAANAWGLGADPVEAGARPAASPSASAGERRRVRSGELLARPAIQAAFTFSAICLFAISLRGNVLPLLLEDLAFTGSAIGIVLGAGSLGQAVVRPFTSLLLERTSLVVTMVVAALLAIAGLVVMPLFTGVAVLAVLAFLHGSGAGLHQSIGLVLVADATDASERGYAVGLRATVNQLATSAAPIIAGGVASAVGLGPSFYVLGALMAACIVWLQRVLTRVEPRPAPVPHVPVPKETP